jgi:hypothetical protein
VYINQRQQQSPMSLQKILNSLDEPVRPEVTHQIISYMKSMPSDKEELISQCITHLESTQTLGSMLAVVHALNDGEFLMRCHSDTSDATNELVSEFEELFKETEEGKNNDAAAPL